MVLLVSPALTFAELLAEFCEMLKHNQTIQVLSPGNGSFGDAGFKAIVEGVCVRVCACACACV